MSAEGIAKVIAHSKKRRDIALRGVIRLEDNIAELEDKLPLSDGERVTLDYLANKLQMYDAEFHDHHYKLLDLIDDSVELVELQNILDGHERLNINLFTRITNIQCLD